MDSPSVHGMTMDAQHNAGRQHREPSCRITVDMPPGTCRDVCSVAVDSVVHMHQAADMAAAGTSVLVHVDDVHAPLMERILKNMVPSCVAVPHGAFDVESTRVKDWRKTTLQDMVDTAVDQSHVICISSVVSLKRHAHGTEVVTRRDGITEKAVVAPGIQVVGMTGRTNADAGNWYQGIR